MHKKIFHKSKFRNNKSFRLLKRFLEFHSTIIFIKTHHDGSVSRYSQNALSTLKAYGVKAHIVNVSNNHELEKEVQIFSGWRYFPQLFVFGEFIGGSLILPEFFSSGEYWRIIQEHDCKKLNSLTGHNINAKYQINNKAIWRLSFSPDRTLVAAACADTKVRVWNVKLRKLCVEFSGHKGWVNSVIFTKASHRLISGSSDTTVRIWNICSQEEEHCMQEHNRWVNDLVLLPDERHFISASADKKIVKWSATDGAKTYEVQTHHGITWSVSVTGNEKSIVTAGSDGLVGLLDTGNMRIMSEFKAHNSCVTCVIGDKETGGFCTTSYDGTVKRWDVCGRLIHGFSGHRERVWSVAQVGHDGFFVTASADGTVQLWSRGAQNADRLFRFEDPPVAVAASAELRVVVVGHLSGNVSWLEL